MNLIIADTCEWGGGENDVNEKSMSHSMGRVYVTKPSWD
jgi:hypothetical protein